MTFATSELAEAMAEGKILCESDPVGLGREPSFARRLN